MGDGESLKSKEGGRSPLSGRIKTVVGNGHRPLDPYLGGLSTEGQRRKSYFSGAITGVIATAAVIAAGAAIFWLGMSKSEGIIKQQRTAIETRDARIVTLEGQLESTLKGALQQSGTIRQNLIELPNLAKKNKWQKYEDLMKVTTELTAQQETAFQQKLDEAIKDRNAFHQSLEGEGQKTGK